MKLWAKNLLFGAGLAGAAAILGGCYGGYAGGGSVEVGADYYGPVYGGPVFYGHPSYRNELHVAGPPERRSESHGDNHRAEATHSAPEHHDAPAQRAGSAAPSGGGHAGTTPESRK